MREEQWRQKYKQQTTVTSTEDKIQETIQKSMEIFYQKEKERMLTYLEFLWTQYQLIQKRWWLFQSILLAAIILILPQMQEQYYIQKSIGIAGVLFVIFVIPELWKNKNYHCMEVEAAAYYSLRQIYAARISIFGVVDVFLLTIFCGIVHGTLQITFAELMVQFLFPMTVTACICFWTLCSPRVVNEPVSVALCMIWSAVWWLITVNESFYTAIVFPVWFLLFGIAIVFLTVVIYKTLHDYSRGWEGNTDGIEYH